jgi:hypothetical protein
MQHSNTNHELAAERLRRLLIIPDRLLPSHRLDHDEMLDTSLWANRLEAQRTTLGYWLDTYERIASGTADAEALELVENMSASAEADELLRHLIVDHEWTARAAVVVWRDLSALLEHLQAVGKAHAAEGVKFCVVSLADTIAELEPSELGRVTRAAVRVLAASVGEEHRDRAALATAAVADLAAVVVADDAVFLELRDLGPELLESERDDELFIRIGENLRRAREGVQR